MMIGNIEIGDMLQCLNCGSPFKLERIHDNGNREEIECPHCKKVYDTHAYHLHGKKLNEKECPNDFLKVVEGIKITEYEQTKEAFKAIRAIYVQMLEAGFTMDEAMAYIAALTRHVQGEK